MTGALEFTSLEGGMIFEPVQLARSVNPERVKQLAASIKENGLYHPIIVIRKKRTIRGQLEDAYEILAGVHRYRAMFRLLNWRTIPVQIVEKDGLHAELVTIEENLIRAELTVSENSQMVARHKEIFEELYPETRHGANKPDGSRVASDATLAQGAGVVRFTQELANKTGKGERGIQQAAERGKKICKAAFDLVKGTPLDSQRYLNVLKDVPKDDQVQRVKYDLLHLDDAPGAKVGRKPSKKGAKTSAPPPQDIENEQYLTLHRAWEPACENARMRFMADIGAVIDVHFMARRVG
jgi:ParB family chromosome partitioning protein